MTRGNRIGRGGDGWRTAGYRASWSLAARVGPFRHPIDETFDRVLDALFDRLGVALKP